MGHPVTLVGFMEMYPTQDACRRALFEQRGREGFRCPRDRRPLRVGLALVLEDHAHGMRTAPCGVSALISGPYTSSAVTLMVRHWIPSGLKVTELPPGSLPQGCAPRPRPSSPTTRR